MFIPKESSFKNVPRTCANTGCTEPCAISSRWCEKCEHLPKNFGTCTTEGCNEIATTHKKNHETGKIDVPCCGTCLRACFSNKPSMSELCGDSGGSFKYDDSDGDEGYVEDCE